jgi:hypothetical protein
MNELLTPALWAGAGAGAVATLLIMVVILLLRRNVLRRRNARRDRIITSVQEKSTDVDSLIVSYRAGKIDIDEFRNSLSEKIEIINRTYKPGIHLLDIFFIKYAEKLIEEYYRMLDTGVVEPSQRETVAFSISPLLQVIKKAQKETSEEATLVSKAGKESKASAEATVAGSAPEPDITEELSGDAVISAIAEASKEENDLPLETFLEMETGAGVIGATARVLSEPEVRKEEEEQFIPQENKVEKADTTEKKAKETKKGKAKDTAQEDNKPISRLAPVPAPVEAEFPEETMIVDSEFAFSDTVSGQTPGAVKEEKPAAGPEKEDEETMSEAAVSFPVKMSVSPQVEPPRPVIPLRPPAPPEHRTSSEETIQQPATIEDIEAETIIADRSELLGVNKVAGEPQADKSQLGITGDDVSDMLDQFFGGNK